MIEQKDSNEVQVEKRFKFQLPTRSQLILAFLIPILVLSGFLWGYYLGGQKTHHEFYGAIPPTQPPPTPISEMCKQYGLIPPEEYLQSYTVASGETPQSIITKIYGNDSRVKEFIALNQNFKISIDQNNGPIPAGTKVYLPVKEIKSSSGLIYGKAGLVRQKLDDFYWIQTRTENSVDGDTPVYTFSRTVYKSQPKVGDCIVVITDSSSDYKSTHVALLIRKQ